eukprot:gene7072-1265_t
MDLETMPGPFEEIDNVKAPHFPIYIDSDTMAWVVMDRMGKSANALNEAYDPSPTTPPPRGAPATRTASPPPWSRTPRLVFNLAAAVARVNELANAGKVKAASSASAKKDFCAGADVTLIKPLLEANEAAPSVQAAGAAAACQDVFASIEQLPCTTIAALNGSALGGGLELALACQFRVVTDEDNAQASSAPFVHASVHALPCLHAHLQLALLAFAATL